MEVTSSTGPIVKYQEGHNIPVKYHKINLSQKTDSLIMIHNETTTEVYIDKQERINPKSSNNHDTDKSDTYLDKPKQGVQRKVQGEQEVRETEIVKEIAENGQINVGLVNDSPEKGKKGRKDLEKEERNEGQHVEETTVRKWYDNISEILINKGMKSKEMTGKDKINIGVNK